MFLLTSFTKLTIYCLITTNILSINIYASTYCDPSVHLVYNHQLISLYIYLYLSINLVFRYTKEEMMTLRKPSKILRSMSDMLEVASIERLNPVCFEKFEPEDVSYHTFICIHIYCIICIHIFYVMFRF